VFSEKKILNLHNKIITNMNTATAIVESYRLKMLSVCQSYQKHNSTFDSHVSKNKGISKFLFGLSVAMTMLCHVNLLAQSPGCVPNTNLKIWVKADDGILTGDAVSVSSWTDKSVNGYNLTQTTAGHQPKYQSYA
jgi:hypothetical protein